MNISTTVQPSIDRPLSPPRPPTRDPKRATRNEGLAYALAPTEQDIVSLPDHMAAINRFFETIRVAMIPTMQNSNCFNSHELISRKMNVKSESFQWIYIKSENSKINSKEFFLITPSLQAERAGVRSSLPTRKRRAHTNRLLYHSLSATKHPFHFIPSTFGRGFQGEGDGEGWGEVYPIFKSGSPSL